MADYRIVCVTEHLNDGHDGHIINVGTGTEPTTYSKLWTVAEVWAAIDSGDTFHTISKSTGKRAEVRKHVCRANGCNRKTLKSDADSVTDNNLDNLPACKS